MYENFYHLRAKPFRLSPDPSFFFASRGHKRALAYLRYGLSQAEGFVVITGAPGTGKTTLAQILLQEMGQSDVVVAHLTTTQLEADEMLRMVLASFGLRYESQDKADLLKTLEAFFMARSRENKRVLLVVDEAQNLPARSLEELRMLSNLQVGDKALLQTFLLGQVQFRQMLDHPDLEQLRQRVIANYHLSELGEDECQSYVESRLTHVGWNDDPHFANEAFEFIYKYTEGVPRRINMLCDRVLLFSSLEEQHTIDEGLLKDVTDELQSEISGKPIARPAKVDTDVSREVEVAKPADTQQKVKHPTATDSSEAISSRNAKTKTDAPKVSKPSESTGIGQDDVPEVVTTFEDGGMDRAMPDDGWTQHVAQAQPDNIETDTDHLDKSNSEPAEMERFRVIAGGREATESAVEASSERPANQPASDVMAPLPDAPGDAQEVVLRKILRLVLAFHRSPRSFPGLDDPSQPLPKGITAILELAIADDRVLSGLRQIAVMGISPAMLRAAVRFFVRRVLFLPGGDDFRVLGLASGATLAEVETHYGLLMKLLRQDKKANDEGGVARVGDAYERLCRSEITPRSKDVEEGLSDTASIEEDLDLDLSPSMALGANSGVRSAPTNLDGVVTNEERSAPTARNIMLIAGAVVIVSVLYLTQIKTTENVAPNLTVAEPEKAEIVETPDVPSTSELASTDSTANADVIEPAVVEQKPVDPTAEERLAAEAAAKAEEDARIAAQAEADAEREAQAQAQAAAKAEEQARANEEARIEAAAAKAQARAEAEAEAKALAAAKAKAKEEATLKAQAAAKAKAAKEAKLKAAAAAKAKARAAAEAKAKAEKEARIKDEIAAKAKAAAAAKAKAEAETKRVASSGVVSLAALNEIITGFEKAYQAGDLNTLMQLHSSTVRTNDQINLAGVRSDYQSLFASTSERSFKFSNLTWEREQKYAGGIGQYAISVLRKGESAAYKETGKITLQLASVSGKIQITRFYTSDSIVVEAPKETLAKAEPAKTSVNPFSRISTKELGALLNKLTSTYAAGNIDGFMALFAKDAQTNDRATVKGIREDYVGLFNGTSSRSIDFTKMQWKWDGSIAHGGGTYVVEVQPNGKDTRDRYQGQVWIQVERRDGVARITHFAFSE